VKCIIEALPKNKSLTKLSLQSNRLLSITADAFQKAISQRIRGTNLTINFTDNYIPQRNEPWIIIGNIKFSCSLHILDGQEREFYIPEHSSPIPSKPISYSTPSPRKSANFSNSPLTKSFTTNKNRLSKELKSPTNAPISRSQTQTYEDKD